MRREMFTFLARSRIFPLLLSAFAVSILGQDAKTAVFPLPGNGSVLESSARVETALRQDMTRSSELIARPTTTAPVNNFLLGNVDARLCPRVVADRKVRRLT